MSAVAAPPVSTTVSGAPPPTPAVTPPAVVPAAQPPAEDVAAIKARLAELENQNGELTRTAQFWADKAKGGAPAPKAKPDVVDDDNVDVLDVLTTKGVKGLDELMAKRGYVRKDYVDQTVDGKANQITSEAQLLKDYPDLSNKKSEFFQATAMEYGSLVKSGVPEAVAMQMAAERTDLRFLREGKTKTPQQEETEKKAAKEQARLERIKAQSGTRGGQPTADDEADDELTPEQKRTAIAMLAGDGVTDEQAIEKYKARAKRGVTVMRK